MKKLLFPVLFFCLVATATQAQNDSEQTSAEDFSYSYGVLFGNSLKMQGLTLDDVDAEAFLEGMKAILTDKNAKVDMKTAQAQVNAKIQEAQAKKSKKTLADGKTYMDENAKKEGVKVTESGIQYEILKQGEGEKPKATSKVTTHYHGTLVNGDVFDSSVERGQPATFPVNGVIKGWQEILQMMPVGSKWRVTIPPHLAYGNRPAGKIPANSTLIFEIELIKIEG